MRIVPTPAPAVGHRGWNIIVDGAGIVRVHNKVGSDTYRVWLASDESGTGTHFNLYCQVEGFLTAQLKALELLGVRDDEP